MTQGFATTGITTYPSSVLQVVTVTNGTQITTNTETWAEISSAWRLTVAPLLSTSKLRLQATIPVNSTGTNIWRFKFYDITNAANVGVGSGTGGRVACTATYRGPAYDANDCAFVVLDAVVDATNTTARVYSIYAIKESTGSESIYFNYSNSTAGDFNWDAKTVFSVTEINTVQQVAVIPSATISSGSGAPASTPGKIGDIYLDTAAKREYRAYGTSSSADWTLQPFALSYVRRKNGLTRGSTNTNVIIYGTAVESAGSDITYVNSATSGDSFTINTSGIYSISVTNVASTQFAVTEINIGTTIGNTITTDSARGQAQSFGNSTIQTVSWTGYIAATYKVWILCSSTILASADVDQVQVSVTRVA